jgi:hypothetical protein
MTRFYCIKSSLKTKLRELFVHTNLFCESFSKIHHAKYQKVLREVEKNYSIFIISIEASQATKMSEPELSTLYENDQEAEAESTGPFDTPGLKNNSY